jgi:hypothetical protein
MNAKGESGMLFQSSMDVHACVPDKLLSAVSLTFMTLGSSPLHSHDNSDSFSRYLTSLSVARIYIVELWDERWLEPNGMEDILD